MTLRSNVGKMVGGIVLGGFLTLAALPGGSAQTDGGQASAGLAGGAINAADFDVDVDVDGRDFLIWRPGSSPATPTGSDLADWQSNYAVGPASAAPLPDPEYKYISIRRF